MSDDFPDLSWTPEQSLIWVAGELREIKGDIKELKEGHRNHLKHHDRLLIAFLTIIGTAFVGLIYSLL